MAPVAERDQLREVVRDLLRKDAGHEQVRASADSAVGYSEDLWRRLNAELEIGRLAVPEAVGGHGFGIADLAVVLEECGAALLPEPVLGSAVLGCQALAAADQPAGIGDLLEPALAGELVVAVSQGGAELTAERTSDGWLVRGRRERVPHGAAADLVVVDAATPEGSALFVLRTDDLEVAARTTIDPTRRQADLAADAAPARCVVGPERAPRALERLRTLTALAVAAEHAGIVGELLRSTVEYVEQREQFGRAIGSFQAVKHRLADVLVDQERARSAARYAALAYDADPAAAALPATIAAAVCGDAAMRTAHEAVQLHGGIGFTWEHHAHYYVRRVLGDEGLFGSSRAQRARVADLVGV
ncbi:acyl-CoA dehydrogenase family protein [Nocardioides nitrophenolicus]|uniref:acyl-CoA dehydrogenase family protein n=1 Tax=Nocardioides nitrophenolicus TaxID=60489 RepID=UPI001958FFFF|nr:acyl-CoA dehydrogenase family protein [Nocardioides nitrophenolicus]MBM7518479.1 acyl-CoA dehydrogenase [Nocardioides nitrophenolicus]